MSSGPSRPPSQKPAFGDRAEEHLTMKRGQYHAWIYVVIGFLSEIFFFSGVFRIFFSNFPSPGLDQAFFFTSFALGAGVSYLIYRDRWRVNEAFSSRFCSGLANFSILYVPVVSWCYANYRAVQKFRGK